MRKTMILVLAVVLVAGITACKKSEDSYAALGKYAEVGPVMDKFITANETFVDALDKATTADHVAAALEAVAASLTELAPKMNEITVKFPEFKSQDEPPVELKPFQDRINVVMGKLMGAMGKAAPFMQDPKVIAAQEKYNTAMGLIQ